MKTMKTKLVTMAAMAIMVVSSGVSAFATEHDLHPRVMDQIRKELVTLPFYGVFDSLRYTVDGSTVTLHGEVLRPTTRVAAERRIARIEGIDRVVNNIEVLPPSRFDDEIRIRTYRAVFSAGSLYRYAQGAVPSIHIVVNRGNVTLEGVVANQSDSQLAYLAASGVSGVFSVTNNLQVSRS